MAGRFEDNVFFIGDFDDALENDVVIPLTKEIEVQAKKRVWTPSEALGEHHARIDLHVNSVGGYAHLCYNLVELVELAKQNGVLVRTVVPDIAFSAGSMLAITGTPGQRYIGKHAEHLVHYGQQMSFESTPTQVERFTKFKERTFKTHLAHYKKYTNIPNLESEMLDDGFFVVAKNAIKWGLADKYLDKFILV